MKRGLFPFYHHHHEQCGANFVRPYLDVALQFVSPKKYFYEVLSNVAPGMRGEPMRWIPVHIIISECLNQQHCDMPRTIKLSELCYKNNFMHA